LIKKGVKVNSKGITILIYDSVKLGLYLIFFGNRFLILLWWMKNNWIFAGTGDFINFFWIGIINILVIYSFIIYYMLSSEFDTNEVLKKNEFIDSFRLGNMNYNAQVCDSFLILLNLMMLIEFTKISRKVSLLTKILKITCPYLAYLIGLYLVMLSLLSLIVWQVWGDKLRYFRNFTSTSIYCMALFDMKSMYLA